MLVLRWLNMVLKRLHSGWAPVTHACNPNYLDWEAEIGRTAVLRQPGQVVQETLISKITKTKWTRGMTQTVECLFCKLEVPKFKAQSYI
jgi:hypothetical protein